ncbi:hypothetical protein C9374_008156 [Naegleria lovaniensis]|uniref:Importin subunit alpha n=1 Tax=Naegleria lovaniensis TaxID=51637 RepID=A0AA88GFI6_NAELO|nr:uncharacterized protein C9374_008156 [Naegleria lovaniensis]KAG2378517.1 hypothetical protein C9374_008156 [Naegleria lovaniensis]
MSLIPTEAENAQEAAETEQPLRESTHDENNIEAEHDMEEDESACSDDTRLVDSPNPPNDGPLQQLIRVRVSKLRERDQRLKQFTNKVLGISKNMKRRKNIPSVCTLSRLSYFVLLLDPEFNGMDVIYEAVRIIRRLLSVEVNPPIQEVVDSGACVYMTKFLSRSYLENYFEFIDTSNVDHNDTTQTTTDNNTNNNEMTTKKRAKVPIFRLHSLQHECAWALTNVASGTTEHTRYIISLKCIERMIDLLDSGNFAVVGQAVWAIGNFAGDSPYARDLALQRGAIKKVVQALRDGWLGTFVLSDMKNAAWCLSNLVRMKPIPPTRYLLQALPAFMNFIFHNNEEILTDTCWALSYISESFECVSLMKESPEFMKRLVDLLTQYSVTSVVIPSIRTFGNLLLEDGSEEIVLKYGFLDHILALLTHTKRAIQKETLWTLSNIVSESVTCCEKIISDPDIFPRVLELLSTNHEPIITEGLYVMINFSATAEPSHIVKFVEKGFFTQLLDLYGNMMSFTKATRSQYIVALLYPIKKYQLANAGGTNLIMITEALMRRMGSLEAFRDDVKESMSVFDQPEHFTEEVKALTADKEVPPTYEPSNEELQQ